MVIIDITYANDLLFVLSPKMKYSLSFLCENSELSEVIGQVLGATTFLSEPTTKIQT